MGQTLAEDLAGKADLVAWDIAFADPDSIPSRALPRFQLRAAESALDAVRGAHLVISAVTAARDLDAAQSVADGLEGGAFFLDLNSCSPGQKTASAKVIHAGGGRYVEAAVMSPIGPKRIASPMLLGGTHARAFLQAADGLGFAGATAYSEVIGQAAATKLCRSVMIKGIEALLTESMLAARHYGVEQVVLDSLSDLLPLPRLEPHGGLHDEPLPGTRDPPGGGDARGRPHRRRSRRAPPPSATPSQSARTGPPTTRARCPTTSPPCSTPSVRISPGDHRLPRPLHHRARSP
ncbi:NAD(P)-binding domain-containing protein [Phenylobacterium sp. J367]|nr:NAD(P)-binding domain-containing protein [Phenylobacterium sp. J367]MCR5879832.1 NAD(P)-binding domain-containing protein [Phenylobacterium sp. J367]